MYRLLIFDIDGVFTDGKIIVDETGKEYKSYHLAEVDALMSLKCKWYCILEGGRLSWKFHPSNGKWRDGNTMSVR